MRNKENSDQNLTKEKQEKVYNLKNDIIFKAFFGRKGNEEFLIDFYILWKAIHESDGFP